MLTISIEELYSHLQSERNYGIISSIGYLSTVSQIASIARTLTVYRTNAVRLYELVLARGRWQRRWIIFISLPVSLFALVLGIGNQVLSLPDTFNNTEDVQAFLNSELVVLKDRVVDFRNHGR